jgi:hypothetical protein
MRYQRSLIAIGLLAIVGGLVFGLSSRERAALTEGPALRSPEYGDAFWSHWGDGHAELAGYDLTYTRYGELREGTAVTIFVTETFDNDQRVKSDGPKRLSGGSFPVLKLNLVQDFPTGIYDYNMMTSVFTALEPVNGRPAGSLTKASFSSQEWCGHAFAQALFDGAGVRYTSHSYFDGEADVEARLENPQNGLSEDALLLWARGFAAPMLNPGESQDVRLLRSLERVRLRHSEVEWQPATLSRSAEAIDITIPAGSFQADVFTVVHEEAAREAGAVAGSRTRTFWVETAAPHRLLRWSDSEGLNAELLASDRLQYWAMNRNGMESALRSLGLESRTRRTP